MSWNYRADWRMQSACSLSTALSAMLSAIGRTNAWMCGRRKADCDERAKAMVIVDDMQAPFGRMVMCHMLADTTDELLEMADKIGVDRKWIQNPGAKRAHFDICKSKRALAIANGAQEVTMQGVMDLMRSKRDTEQAAT